MCRGDEKMKILILTVAGLSTRFSESIGEPCLKCIFYRNSIKESLLYRMLHQKEAFDKYVIVGGYMFEQLKTTLENDFTEIQDKIIFDQERPIFRFRIWI